MTEMLLILLIYKHAQMFRHFSVDIKVIKWIEVLGQKPPRQNPPGHEPPAKSPPDISPLRQKPSRL